MFNRSKKTAKAKEARITGAASTASAGGAIAGIHNVCHSICLLAVAVLSIFGVMIAADSLMWLQDLALPFWTFGVAMLALTMLMRMRFGNCISLKLMVANTGLLVIGVPFVQSQAFAPAFWAVGAAVAAYAVTWHISGKAGWKIRFIPE